MQEENRNETEPKRDREDKVRPKTQDQEGFAGKRRKKFSTTLQTEKGPRAVRIATLKTASFQKFKKTLLGKNQQPPRK